MVGRRSGLHAVAHQPQLLAVKNVIEHEGTPAPGDVLRLYRRIARSGELAHQNLVPADVEIPAEQRGARGRPQLIGYELALTWILFAVCPEHEKRQEMRVENPQIVAPQGGSRANQQPISGRLLLALELEFDRGRRQVEAQWVA